MKWYTHAKNISVIMFSINDFGIAMRSYINLYNYEIIRQAYMSKIYKF